MIAPKAVRSLRLAKGMEQKIKEFYASRKSKGDLRFKPEEESYWTTISSKVILGLDNSKNITFLAKLIKFD